MTPQYAIPPEEQEQVKPRKPRPKLPTTPRVSIRVKDALWEKFKARTYDNGDTASEVLRRFMEEYTRD